MKKNITPQQVHIIARIQFKQSGYILYKVSPSNGGKPYEVSCKPDGTVTSCICLDHTKGHNYCKHMTACQAAEDLRREGAQEVKKEKLERRHVAPLHSAREFSMAR